MSTINTTSSSMPNAWTAGIGTTTAAPALDATTSTVTASQRNATGFVSGTSNTTTGGGLGADLAQAARDVLAKGGNAVDALVGMASTGMKSVQDELSSAQAAGKDMDASTISLATQRMSNYTTMMQMAKKLQDSQEEATRVWVR